MNAKEAYELAAKNGGVESVLVTIKAASERGETHVTVPRLNDFQVAKLFSLGYSVSPDQGESVFGLAGHTKALYSKIDWSFPGRDPITGIMSDIDTLSDRLKKK